MEYSIVEVIEQLADKPKATFKRVNDKKFTIRRGYRGDILIYIKGECKGVMPIFNYLHDKFTLIKEDKE